MKNVSLYTDGSCSPSTGKGGWAFILRYQELGYEICVAGKDEGTTNNRMEMMAVIEGMSRLNEECDVNLYADSKYVLDGMRTWLPGWKKNGWKKSDKKDVKNKDLWLILDQLKRKHRMNYIWIKGHNDHPENEQVDEMASIAKDELIADIAQSGRAHD